MNKCFVYFLIFKHALAKLGKNESVTIEIIDKLCIYLKVQPSDIVQVYEIEEIDNREIKNKTRFPDAYSYCTHVHSNRQKSMKIAFVDGIFAHWPSLTYGQRSKCADLCEQ